jgi:uncharacterized membrane protein YhaH (DUF805 family)
MRAIRYNLSRLIVFRGRESRALFWPYAGSVVALAVILMMAIMLPSMMSELARAQQFAAAHPDLATVQSGPGSYSISIDANAGYRPDVGGLMRGLYLGFAVSLALLAAAVTRRLHDRNKSGAWGLMPLPFILFSSIAMPALFSLGRAPDLTLFFSVFVSNLAYLATLVFLVVLLAGPPTDGPNRYDTERL